MDLSPNLNLPYLAQGQAQKHVTVNESLQRLDALTQLVAASAATSAQPDSPIDGQLYILPSGKTGDAWDAMADHALAYYRDGAWEEIAPRPGWLAYVADAGRVLAFDGAAWAPLAHATQGWRVLAASAVALSHTGSTSETALATISIPAHAMGPNGLLRVTSVWSCTPNANSKTARIRFGAASMWSSALTTNTSMQHQFIIANAGVANAQKAFAGGGAFSGSATSPASASNDTTAAVDLTLRAALANAGDTMTLESYVVEIAFGA